MRRDSVGNLSVKADTVPAVRNRKRVLNFQLKLTKIPRWVSRESQELRIGCKLKMITDILTKYKFAFRFYFSLLCTLFVLTFTGCQKPESTYVIQGFFYDTYISITLYEAFTPEFEQECLALCQSYEQIFSPTQADSEVYQINHNAGSKYALSSDCQKVLEIANTFARQTNGICDYTIYPVSQLWDFHNSNSMPPAPEEIAQQIAFVNYENVDLSNGNIQLKDGMQIDLGFIAKGYIADELRSFLFAHGYEQGIINLGGNIVVLNKKESGELYEIGIEMPFYPGSVATSLQIENGAVVTSGIYQRYFMYENTLYHHLLDCQTGYPVESNLLSVTIYGPEATICDGLSTSCYLLGYEKSQDLLSQYPEYHAIFITDTYEILNL